MTLMTSSVESRETNKCSLKISNEMAVSFKNENSFNFLSHLMILFIFTGELLLSNLLSWQGHDQHHILGSKSLAW